MSQPRQPGLFPECPHCGSKLQTIRQAGSLAIQPANHIREILSQPTKEHPHGTESLAKGLDLDAISDLYERRMHGFASIEHDGQLMDAIPSLLAEIRRLQSQGSASQAPQPPTTPNIDIAMLRRAHILLCNWVLSEEGCDPDAGLDLIKDIEAAHPEFPQP